MKKIYLIPVVLFVIGVICFFSFGFIGSYVAPDGTLVEPFYLVLLGWASVFLTIISGVIINMYLWYQKKLSKTQKIITTLAGVFLMTFGMYINMKVAENKQNDVYVNPEIKQSASVRNATYTIENEPITLANGVSEISIPNSSSSIITRYFGNEVSGDFNGDQREDKAFLLTQETGGSGTFYYVTVALLTDNGYQGLHAILLGDRIAPQTTEIHDGKIVVNYAERKQGEPMTARPSIGVSKTFAVVNNNLIEIK